MTNGEILEIVCDFFIESHDFNGISASNLIRVSSTKWQELQPQLAALARAREIDCSFASIHENPHIKRLPDLPVDAQVFYLNTEDADCICVYPSAALLRMRTEISQYDDRPYTRRLALAEPQLTVAYFELSILERYFRDPRYASWFGDIGGSIVVRDEHYLSGQMAERDKVLLQTFGIGYDEKGNRVVGVFLRDLSGLSAEHQQTWLGHEMPGPCVMNSDYARACIWGLWPEHHSVYQAFIQEQTEINKLCTMIEKPLLFKKTFEANERPIEFAPMLRPTLKYFQEFALTLDKMLSENMNRDFFKDDIPLQLREETADGKIKVTELNTISLLQQWLTKHYRNKDGRDKSREVLEPMRAVRKARQPPAHDLRPDEFDLTLPKKQDDLLAPATAMLRTLRLILSSHPKAEGYFAPDWLDADKIVFY